ncbi:amino acid ABC transporter substrate-binding protein, PAAT family (TC 3.A.1.3.-)/amino acid ABC transporter membrane protein, PAAT family (TC 3.A.1.3.-) [Lactobacillus bombicola]|uniref:Amino acid ABC transporter substrate-binding protein, PAAT family (TC 3.A.1.3.-)/amino acid ABC transporter membrane protein, PAAT family (TC 3.A.1.3.-) n=1 Tax=Lactobacillus bombicola TaxID=1505723 RepID=A0A1I1TSX3_9LACO|nr:ABC transporter substrate-binding protein/permease [Lactobacillus bombicola]MCO6528372.1 ABC transporter substrate-binding protein/permease [Lactobacillus sp.]SFD59563.1 amino acid ABC transporter substrate-binding protein, PAAT family (TC 3.A.1.3.-)/amino acid ABC transporter membrane protein, PAAT family (TC 3.A.1.3.-) [Lactobacillus bombicola]
MKSRYKWITAVMIAIISMTFGLNCNSNSVSAKKDSNVLKVAMEANYQPYNWTQTNAANGAVPIDGSQHTFANGYDVKIAKIIGKKMHRKVVVLKTEWDGLLPALTSGKADLIIAGMSPTAERAKAINFSQPYRRGTFVVITKPNSKFAHAKKLTDFKGAKLTAQQGTSHYGLIKELPGAKRQTAMRDFAAMRQSLISGTIDGYLAEDTEAISFKLVDPDIKAIPISKIPGFHVSKEESETSIGIAKPNKLLLKQVNQILATIPTATRNKMMTAAIKEQPKADDNKKGQSENWFISMWKQYGSMLVSGIGMTLLLASVGTIAGFFIGLAVGIIRTIPTPTTTGKKLLLKVSNWLLSVYIEVFRGTPMMVQAAVIYYGIAQFWHLNINRTIAALIIVSINTGAYLAEIIRGGIISTPAGQFEAASALGMTHNQRMWHIILPQAIKNCLPSITNEFIVNIKDTSVLSIISVSELFFVGTTVASQTFKFFPTYLTISAIYLILTFTITRIFNLIEKHLQGNKNYNLMANQVQVGTTNDMEVKK